jgi:hypothetical protein
MCGLVLLVNKNTNGFSWKQRDVFNSLLFLDTLRGDDSTGMFVVDNIGNVSLAKEASMAPIFMADPAYKDLIQKAYQTGWAAVGHNRKATRGSITDENAHPFVVDDRIVLVHNGSFNGSHKHLKDTEVDSEAIAHMLAENSDPETALRKVNAAYALIWYDVDAKTMHVVRNSQRPLWYMETHDSYIMASEKAFLQFVIDRHDLKPTEGLYEVKENNLFSMTLSANKSTETESRELDCSFWKHNPTQTHQTEITTERHYYSGCDEDEYWEQMLEHHGIPSNRSRIHEAGVVQRALALSKPTQQVNIHRLPSSNDKLIVNTKDKVYTDKVLGEIYDSCKTVTFAEFTRAQESLKDGQKIKVIINAMVEADDDPKTSNFLMIGKPLNEHKCYTTFFMHEKNWGNLFASSNDAVFEVEVNGYSWHRTESHDSKKDVADMYGVMILHTKNPIPIYVETKQNVH